jgi:hypothetical protein
MIQQPETLSEHKAYAVERLEAARKLIVDAMAEGTDALSWEEPRNAERAMSEAVDFVDIALDRLLRYDVSEQMGDEVDDAYAEDFAELLRKGYAAGAAANAEEWRTEMRARARRNRVSIRTGVTPGGVEETPYAWLPDIADRHQDMLRRLALARDFLADQEPGERTEEALAHMRRQVELAELRCREAGVPTDGHAAAQLMGQVIDSDGVADALNRFLAGGPSASD